MKKLAIILFVNFLIINFIVGQTNFYGTSAGGGSQDKGTVFKTDSNGNNPTIVYDFTQKNRSSNPLHSSLTSINNQIYGTTYEGGMYNTGTIYKLNSLTNSIETIYDFSEISGGPLGELVLANNGLYYGLAEYGGINGYGILYSFDYTNNSVSTVYSFNINEMPNSIIHNNGVLYFFSTYGGISMEGDISSFNISTNVYTSLHSFNSINDLATPAAHIFFDGYSKLYGTCLTDPNNIGGIFSYDITSNTYNVDTLLTIEKGFYSVGKFLKLSNGLMYSTTQKGGSNYILNPGTIYSFDPITRQTSQLFLFNSVSGYKAAGNLVQISANEIVGYTEEGGNNNSGVLYKFNVLTNTYTKLYDFTLNDKKPLGSLLFEGNKIYGNFSEDPNIYNNTGSIYIGGMFMYDINTAVMKTVSFQKDQGVNPSGGLVNIGTKIIGMTAAGGLNNCGTVYTYDLNTSVKKDIYSFPINTGYNSHRGRLVKATNGKLYGTSQLGGSGGYGYIFEVDPLLDTVLIKYNFDANYNSPLPEMTLASDGNFYGVCIANGNNLGGALIDARNAFYKFDVNTNAVSILEHVFISGSNSFNGADFNGGMIEIGNSLQFLGTCSRGGTFYQSCTGIPLNGGPGLVFKFDANSNNYSIYFDNRCQSMPYTYPDLATNMIYLNQDSVFLINTADLDYVNTLGGRVGKIIHINTNNNTYIERSDVSNFNTYLSFSSSPLIANNKNFYMSSFNQTTPIAGFSKFYNGSFFEYNPYSNNLIKKFDFNDYGIYSPFGGLIEISSNIITPYQDVWPGDANSDGIADNLDVLELGLHYTQTGAPRATVSNTWQSYFANNWIGNITNGKNLKHSDCNGDGIIDNDDTLAIYNNYGLTHAFKPEQAAIINPQLSIVPDQTSVVKGTWGTASIYAGDAVNSINNVNGVAFTVYFDNTLIETNNIYIEYQNSFMDAGQNLHFRKLDFANGKIFTATTHTLNNNVSGNGLIAKLHYQIKSDLATDEVLNIGLSKANQSNASGIITPLTSGAGTLMAIGASVGLQELNGNLISVSPNPTNGSLTINSKTELQKIEVVAITGQVLLSEVPTNVSHPMNLDNFANGIYFVNLYQNNRIVKREKVVLNK